MVTCSKCSDGYFLYPNTYLFQVFDDDKQFVDTNSDSANVYADYLEYNSLAEANLFMNPAMRHCKKTEVRSPGAQLPRVRVLQPLRRLPRQLLQDRRGALPALPRGENPVLPRVRVERGLQDLRAQLLQEGAQGVRLGHQDRELQDLRRLRRVQVSAVRQRLLHGGRALQNAHREQKHQQLRHQRHRPRRLRALRERLRNELGGLAVPAGHRELQRVLQDDLGNQLQHLRRHLLPELEQVPAGRHRRLPALRVREPLLDLRTGLVPVLDHVQEAHAGWADQWRTSAARCFRRCR